MTDNPWFPLFLITKDLIQSEQLPEPDSEYFLQKAAQTIDSAKNEITYGETIRELLSGNENGLKECQRSLAAIGVWHFQRAVELFRKAIRNLERAGEHGLSQNEKKEVEMQIKDCKKQLATVNKQKDSAERLLDSIGS